MLALFGQWVWVLKDWRTDLGKMIFPFGRGKSKLLDMETVRWRSWYSARLQPCGANLSGLALPPKERNRTACSEDIAEMKFNWCSGEHLLSVACRKSLKPMETSPQGQSQTLSNPHRQCDTVGWGDHDLKILHNWHNHPRILRSEYLPCNK